MQSSHWSQSQPPALMCVRADIMMAAWVNIKMLAPIIIKYHFLFSFTQFVVLIASHHFVSCKPSHSGTKSEQEMRRSPRRERVLGYFIIFSWKLFWLIFDYIWDRGNKEARDEK